MKTIKLKQELTGKEEELTLEQYKATYNTCLYFLNTLDTFDAKYNRNLDKVKAIVEEMVEDQFVKIYKLQNRWDTD